MITIGRIKIPSVTWDSRGTLSKEGRNCLTMAKTNGSNSLTGTDKREGLEGESSAVAAKEWLTGLGRMPDWPSLGGLVGQL